MTAYFQCLIYDQLMIWSLTNRNGNCHWKNNHYAKRADHGKGSNKVGLARIMKNPEAYQLLHW